MSFVPRTWRIVLCLTLYTTSILSSGLTPEEEQCQFAIAILSHPMDYADTDALVLADWAEDQNRDRSAQLLRLRHQIDAQIREHQHGNPDTKEFRKLIAEYNRVLRDYRHAVKHGEEEPLLIPLVNSDKPKQSPFHDGEYFHKVDLQGGRTVVLGGGPNEFHPFEGERTVTMTQSFQISDLITQGQWAYVMGTNPSFIKHMGIFVSEKAPGVNAITVDPNNPVEHMTWWSALVFANRVSKLEGRVPVYDLSGVQFVDVPESGPQRDPLIQAFAAKGSLRPVDSSQQPVVDMKENGYRLPTQSEAEYVKRGGSQNPNFRNAYFFGDDVSELSRYGWYRDNSGGSTQRVGSLAANPLGLSDVHGNVQEFTQDGFTMQGPGGKDPIITVGRSGVQMRGNYYDVPRWLRSGARGPLERGLPGYVGFRLVRNLDPDE